jgi:hypothetical protein
MKKLSLFSIALMCCTTLFAQSPQKINYQGVARNASGAELVSTAIGLRLSVRQNSPSGTIIYRETQSTATNDFGLFNVQLGNGTPVTGTLSAVNWASGTYYLQVEMDANGSSNYVDMGTSQMVSVPYSMHAASAASISGLSGTTNYIPKFTSANTFGNSSIYESSGYVGIGTTNPQWPFQLNTSGSQTVFQISATGSSGSNDLDGLLISYDNNGASFSNMENTNMSFSTGATSRMTIDNNGYVGVGTTNPQWPFQLNTSGSETVLQVTAAGSSGSNDLDGLLISYGNYGASISNRENTDMSFSTNAATRMTISNNGYVGVGTTNPQWPFQLNTSGSQTVFQISAAGSSGSNDLDGLLISYDNNGASFSNMESTNMSFSTNATTRMTIGATGNVGIGTTSPAYDFEVSSSDNIVGHFVSSYGTNNGNGTLLAEATAANTDQRGIIGRNNNTAYWGIGVEGQGGYIGVRGESIVNGSSTRIGVFGSAGNGATSNYAVYGTVSGNVGSIYAGYFVGDVYSTGSYLPSDAALKTGTDDFTDALALVKEIPVKTYEYRHDGIHHAMNLPEGRQVGIMAGDLQQVMPQLVKRTVFEDLNAYMDGKVEKENIPSIEFNAVNYTGLIPVTLKAIQEQQALIEKQQQQIDELKLMVEKLQRK